MKVAGGDYGRAINDIIVVVHEQTDEGLQIDTMRVISNATQVFTALDKAFSMASRFVATNGIYVRMHKGESV